VWVAPWKTLQDEHLEIAVEILGGDAAMATEEGIEPLWRLLTVWIVQFSPDTSPAGLVQAPHGLARPSQARGG